MSVESRHIGAILGLTAFVVGVVSGMAVDNPMDVTLERAMTGLVAGFFVGLLLGGAISHVVQSHVKQYKLNNPLPEQNGLAQVEAPVQIVDEVKNV